MKIEALKARLQSLEDIYRTQDEYPLNIDIVGFGQLNLNTKEALEERMKELETIINYMEN